jgi:Domain of unknown function (DUF4386)
MMDIPRLRERWARDILHCPYCHGHEVRDQRLGLIGGTPGAVRYAQIVRQWSDDLVYFIPPSLLTVAERSELLARGIGVVEGCIEELVIDDTDHLRAVHMDDGCVIPCDALFVPPRRTARIVGFLFLAAFLAYGVGSTIATSIAGSADRGDSDALLITGAALMLLNSAIVIGIGVLMFPILRPHNKTIAVGYLGTRIFEGVGLAIGVVSLLVLTGPTTIDANFVAYNVAMAGLGIGSLFFCSLLFRSGLVPRFLAVWGFVGYPLFAGDSLLELFGVAGAGLVAAIPSGLFEGDLRHLADCPGVALHRDRRSLGPAREHVS